MDQIPELATLTPKQRLRFLALLYGNEARAKAKHVCTWLWVWHTMARMHSSRSLRLSALVLFGGTAQLAAQCGASTFVGSGLDGFVYESAAFDPDGSGPLSLHVAVVGNFVHAGGQVANGIAAWHPATNTWSVFGSGISGTAHEVVGLPNGDLVVGGAFASVGGVSANNVARWNGAAWVAMGVGVPGAVTSMVVLPNGDLVVGGSTPIRRWNGATWAALGNATGQIAANEAGDLFLAGNGILRWNGANWVSHAPGITSVQTFAALPGGGLIAAGELMPNLNHIARWDGSVWTPLGGQLFLPFSSGYVLDFFVLPDGDPVACGRFGFFGSPLGTPAHFARWNGTAWVGLNGQTSGLTNPQNGVHTATFLPDGAVAVGGAFVGNVARIATNCPAQQAPAGAGCAGSGGPNQLTVETLPWLGGTFRARGTGLAALAIVTEVYGFTPLVLPLASLLPQAAAGCNLLVTPDHVNVSIPTAGVTTTQLAIPDAPSLIGLVVLHQLNVYEVSQTFDLTAVTASNAVSVTLGAF